MNKKTTSGKAGSKPVIAKNENSKPSTASHDASTTSAEQKSKETTGISGESPKKIDAPKSASQTSTSHFSSVSTPEYRSGWDKIFGKPKLETARVEPLSKYEQRKALVTEQWQKYQASKNPKHLAVICQELPFFEHPEVGEEIAKLLMDK